MALKKNKGPLLTSKVRGGESDTMREIPPEFRAALDMTVTEQEVPVDVDADALSDTVLSSKVEQTRTDERKKRTVVKPAGPVTLVEKDTNEKKQVVTRTRTMQDTGTAATVPTATKDVQQKNLGIGQTIEEVSEVPEVFSEQTYQKEIPDVVPQRFRVAVPTETTETSSVGTAADPTLGTGDLQKSESQVNKFVKRVRSVFRSLVSLPVSLVSKETNREKQVVTVTETLKTAGGDATPSATQDVDVQNLGDGSVLQTVKAVPAVFDEKTRQIGTPLVIPERFRAAAGVNTKSDVIAGTVPDTVSLASGEVEHSEEEVTEFTKRVKSTQFSLGGTPTLVGQDYDEQFDVILPYSEDLEATGTSIGVNRKRVTPLSDQVDLVHTIDPTEIAAIFDAYLLEFPGTTSLELPEILTALDTLIETNDGDGSFTEDGSAYWDGHGSASLSLRGNGQASVAAMPDVIPIIQQPWGRNIRTKRFVFFLPAPVVDTDVITALETFLADTVSFWPKFRPTSITVICVGQRLSLRADASSQWQDGGSSDSDEHSESAGTGSAKEVGLTIKAVRIPPTLHDAISINEFDTIDKSATAHAEADVSVSADIEVDGSITWKAYATSSATSPTTIPSSGLFVLDVRAEPYKFGYVMIHAEVLDAANV